MSTSDLYTQVYIHAYTHIPKKTSNLLSICIHLPTVIISHQWNHIRCGLLCVCSFTYDIFKAQNMVVCISVVFSFLQSNSIPSFCLSIH